jgi:hypothetical protein
VVEALCYNPEDYGFGTRCYNRSLSIYLILPDILKLKFNRNVYQRRKNRLFLSSKSRPVLEFE